MNHPADPAPNRTLGQRLRLLVDLHTVERGEEPTFNELAAALEARGIGLSRARWSYMLNGHRDVDDPRVLTAIAEHFEVDASFLTDMGPMPDRLAAQLDLIRAMREAKVSAFAARALGDVSPSALNAITAHLDATPPVKE